MIIGHTCVQIADVYMQSRSRAAKIPLQDFVGDLRYRLQAILERLIISVRIDKLIISVRVW